MPTHFKKTPSIILPNDIFLTDEENEELCNLESLKYSFGYGFGQLNDQISLITTTNVGIHYFCIDDMVGIGYVAANANISLDVVKQIVNKLPNMHNMVTKQAYIYLLFNPVVYKDKDLFACILEKAYPLIGESLFSSLLRALTYFPIDTFMVLLKKVNENETNYPTKYYLEETLEREDEIKNWASENNPELDGLPLLWVLKAYGFEKILNSI
jgi:hypothetical protein